MFSFPHIINITKNVQKHTLLNDDLHVNFYKSFIMSFLVVITILLNVHCWPQKKALFVNKCISINSCVCVCFIIYIDVTLHEKIELNVVRIMLLRVVSSKQIEIDICITKGAKFHVVFHKRPHKHLRIHVCMAIF